MEFGICGADSGRREFLQDLLSQRFEDRVCPHILQMHK